MKIDSVKQPNFKAVYIKDDRFNARERELADYISGKLLGGYKPNNEKNITWNEWLKKEKGFDILIKRTKDTRDMLTVFGVSIVKDFNDAAKIEDFFVVGNYHTTDFEPEDILEAYKSEKRANAIGFVVPTVLLGIIFVLGTLFGKTLLKNNEINKEIPQKVIQMKDSITDSLRGFKLNDTIKKGKIK